MMSKVINIIKEYSDEESKRGKALQKLSWEACKIGIYVFSYGFLQVLLSDWIGIRDDKEVMLKLYYIMFSGGFLFYAAAMMPWVFHHKKNIFNLCSTTFKLSAIEKEVKEEINQNNKGE
ncbi:hypothetical protein ACH63S_22505 [Klebsiella pneumoniae]|jgi:hypothetical protein|uniref:hypothetical protein n=1 Tax=Enterobacteriaceae TaxID=543 RepID=UPI000B956387|nr:MULTISPECIES: hypothetical protein [Enterobacteriaceae]ECB1471049.1 hypothetical protein [Salmonella enterica subsp. enterica serovar Isangi]ECF5826128.1 hypothetical protein [Salmonella enterica]ECO1523293.1 hypothetical protein [Salmonella enterica subsp. enterica serovar Corvallis]ECU9140400.1 hypothetical protein [Salmonella enterica subsp. enterica serovar Infantis]EDE5462841.1 hypothetical protein [Salmonella enterica subsp. enterica serovar Stanley]EJS4820385.1 hypothetical protein 